MTTALLVTWCIHSAHAVDESQLPDIGTAGVAALSIDREITYGNSFMRFARAQLPIIDDPVLNEYLSDLGQRLVSHANNIRFPFTFFLIQDQDHQCGRVSRRQGQGSQRLFLNADNESELASVLAHEISHVTQRHIARYLEAQTRQTPMTIAGVVGSRRPGNDQSNRRDCRPADDHGLQAQSAINYTRDNEYEADRIGMQLLYDAGFRSPWAWPTSFKNWQQNIATPPNPPRCC